MVVAVQLKTGVKTTKKLMYVNAQPTDNLTAEQLRTYSVGTVIGCLWPKCRRVITCNDTDNQFH